MGAKANNPEEHETVPEGDIVKASQTPPLPARRAFVVQFRAEADVAAGRFVSRVEHVVSGQAAPFHSLQQLEAFFARILTRLR